MKKIEFNDKMSPQIMGILNLTPDSFYDGGLYKDQKKALDKVGLMLQEGANIIDMGAYSSRPNAVHISEKEEELRLLPILIQIVREFPSATISVDTFRSEIAKKSIEEGAHIINDISGGNMDEKMFKTVAALRVPYILMHMQGNPQNMQHQPEYENVTLEVKHFFQDRLDQLNKIGVSDVILDVGFGFGKTLDQNYKLLKNLSLFTDLKKPLLVGLSRKSMLYKVLESKPENVLHATGVAHAIALLNGASVLRVHDVKEAVEVSKIIKQYQSL